MKVLITVLILSVSVIAQEFQVSNKPGYYLRYDKFANEVYYHGQWNWFLFKTNLTTMETIPAGLETTPGNYPELPIFANHSHKAIYLEIGGNFNYYYLHDFDLDSTWRILNLDFSSPFYISKRRENLSDNKYENYDTFYSITPDDSLLFLGAFFNYTDSTVLSGYPEMYGESERWPRSFSSDTTMIYYSNEELTQLSQYHIYSQRIDTLVITDSNQPITSFAYNKKMNILAYAISQDWQPELHLLYVNKGIDTVVFTNDDISENYSSNYYFSLAWNEKDTLLAFWSEFDLEYFDTGVIYSLAKDTSYLFTNIDVRGSRRRIEWAGTDTLLYGVSYYDVIFGSNLDNTTSVEENNTSINNFQLFQNYPNPFNPSTVIEFNLPSRNFVKLTVFNVLGQEVATLINKELGAGIHKIEFNPVEYNLNLSSGVFLYRLQTGTKSRTKKLIYLK